MQDEKCQIIYTMVIFVHIEFVMVVVIHRQRLGLVPVCGHTVIADFPASSDGGHTGTEVF